MVSDERDMVEEKSNVKQALTMNGFPECLVISIPTIQHSLESTTSVFRDDTGDETERLKEIQQPTSKKSPVVLPYIKGLSEQTRRLFKQYNVPAYFKPMNTLSQLLVRPKDEILKELQVGPVYHIPCDSCDASYMYIGETERTFEAWFFEHRKPSSTTSEVSRHNPEHQVDMMELKVKILAVEPRWFE